MQFISRWKRFRPHRNFVPASLSKIKTVVFASVGVAAATLSGIAIRSSALSSSGAATNADTGGSIAISSMSSSGVGAASLNGAGVLTGVLSSTGSASFAGAGTAYNNTTFIFAGTSDAQFNATLHQTTSRLILQDPVDCVLAGQQTEFKKGRATAFGVKHAFNE